MSDRYIDLAEDIEAHEDEARCIREGIANYGPQLIVALLDRGGFGACSLRQVAREAELSPTYVSMALHGKVILSHSAYLRLAKLRKADPC